MPPITDYQEVLQDNQGDVVDVKQGQIGTLEGLETRVLLQQILHEIKVLNQNIVEAFDIESEDYDE